MMNESDLAPIALFVYNRPQHTARTLEALRANDLAAQSDLVIFSDAPRTVQAAEAVAQVRELIASITGFKSVAIVERPANLGLAASIIDGVTRLCEERGKVIVLEDDLVTSPHFLRFMNDGLICYEHDDRVISIHGYIYPVKDTLPETFFIRGADCWGWATWRRGWSHFDADGSRLLYALRKEGLEKAFNFNNSNDYIGMLKDQIAGRVSSWAIRWYASAFLLNKLTLYPGRSLVQNIGMDNSGTHCGDTDTYASELNALSPRIERIVLEEDRIARKEIERFFRSVRRPLVRRLLSKLRAFMSSRWCAVGRGF